MTKQTHIYLIKPVKPNLSSYQTKPLKQNKTYQTKPEISVQCGDNAALQVPTQ